MESFYEFDSKLVLSTVHASPQSLKNEGNEELELIRGNYQNINFPIIFKQTDGKKFTDILDTGFPNLYLISSRMKKILEENNLTGWKTYPIIFYDKKGNEVLDYHGFSITGRCLELSYNKSRIGEKRRVPTGPICQFYKGATINGWEGADFFMPQVTGHMLISKRAANLLVKEKISNLFIQNIADTEYDLR